MTEEHPGAERPGSAQPGSEEPAELAAVRDWLAAVGAEPTPLPDDVAARLDEALRAEAAADEGNGAGVAPLAAAANVTPLPPRDRPAWSMRVLQAAAVVVLLLAGVGLVVTFLQGGGDSETATTAGKGTAEDAGGRDGSAPLVGGYPVTASDRNWGPDTVGPGVPEIVSGQAGPAADSVDPSPEAVPGEGRSTYRLAGGPDLAECVAALNDGPVTPLGVDLAQWQGSPAAVIVLPTPDDPATVDAWVVAPDCSRADAKVLYFTRVPAP